MDPLFTTKLPKLVAGEKKLRSFEHFEQHEKKLLFVFEMTEDSGVIHAH